jgi:hypothetical protein
MNNILDEVMTMQEAAQYIGITEGSIRAAIKLGKLKENIEYRKAGRITLITVAAVERLWGGR